MEFVSFSLDNNISHATSSVPTIMLAWGTVMTLMSLVDTYEGLIMWETRVLFAIISSLILCSARIFLGLTEGGLFPGVTYYISLWYPRQMQAKRVAIFFSAATIAGAFGSILSYGIGHLDG